MDGRLLGPWWVAPFIGLLLSVALLPGLTPGLWHRHFGKVVVAWALAFLVPCVARFGLGATALQVLRMEVLDFLPFLIPIGALYTIAGGIRVTGALAGSPLVNTGALALGAGLASVIGTTGAAMLLIRPLLRANQGRERQTHVVIFFIFLVANIGGALSPLGDPPLFIGFVQGVDFFWPLRHLGAPMALMVAALLVIFFGIDLWCWRREAGVVRPPPPSGRAWPRLEGGLNLLPLAGVIGAVLLQAEWKSGLVVSVFGVAVAVETLVAEASMLVLAALSLILTPMARRRANAFTWAPLVEAAQLFAAVFVTVIPALAILHAGAEGAAAGVLAALEPGGAPAPALYFWATGLLSSLLDNAPTYLIFFHAAGGDAKALMTTGADTLTAISAGAVFMGAATYIGNAPNFLVRAIAIESGVAMPGFLGYVAWSALVLGPLFLALTAVFFRG